MAKLGSYFGLCPLIDQKSLLGVSEDCSPGCVIVTLGKNMAIKYKLSDQKQLHSWSTKEKLSSPVIFDKKQQKYVAIFNQNFMRFWDAEENNIDKLKKNKFPVALHTLLPGEDEPFLIFKTGHVYSLSHALEVRKDMLQQDIIDKTDTIVDQTYLKINDATYVGVLVKTKNSHTYLWVTPNSNVINKIPLERNFSLIGHLLTNTDYGPILYTLWSDGRLFSYPLLSPEEVQTPGNFFSVIETLSRKHEICMVSLNNNYIAMYGADSNQEGASLQIYNTQFKLTQSKHQFKLFTEGSKLWLIGTSLLLTVGQNLAVVPFHLATEQLAALIGSHKLIATADDEDLAIVTEVNIGSWEQSSGPQNKTKALTVPQKIKTQINSFLKEGWSEVAICEEIFPKMIEKRDTTIIMSALKYFVDVPEDILVKLLSFCTSSSITGNNQITPKETNDFLDHLLTISYSDVIIMTFLRNSLKFEEVLFLLQYLCFLLSENGHPLPGVPILESEQRIIDWGCLLLDAHYQQFLLSRDSNIAEILLHFQELVDTYYVCLENLKNVEPILNKIKRGKCGNKISKGTLKYSIEKIKMY